jgi:1-acyl-sn-glycerol-3-phosphate acyltransferase
MIPVLPIYISGASNILPPGTRESQPAAVEVRIGDLIRFEEGTQIGEAKKTMEQAMHSLAADSTSQP